VASSDVVVRLRLAGQAAFTAATTAAAAGVRGIGDASGHAEKASASLGTRLGKGLRTIAPLAASGAAALGAAGVAAAGLGIKFNASMEQSNVAFTNLLGSSSEAQAMLDRLYKVAAKTPFEFPQLVQSTQRLLGFGMAAKDVEPTMRAVGDAVAAAGGGSEQIDRVSTALGQIQAKGKVSSEELLQLAESGVPALKILQDELGLTGQQLTKKLAAGAVSADVGIAALTKGIEKRYGGMAAAQSKTFSGMLSTLKDNATQTLGYLTGPLFSALSSKVLPAVNRVTAGIAKWAKGGGVTVAINALKAGFSGKSASETAGYSGALQAVVKVGRVLGVVFRSVRTYTVQLFAALKPLAPFIQNILWPLLKGFAIGALGGFIAMAKLLIPVIRVIATVLGWIGQKAAPLAPWFQRLGVVIGFLASGPMLKAGLAATRLGAYLIRVLGAVTKILPAVGRLGAALGGALTKGFGSAVRAAGSALSGFKAFGSKIVRAIVEGIKAAPGAVLGAIKSLVPGGKVGAMIRKAIPGLAGGGVMSSSGPALVGERGPELLQLPGGARVTPLPHVAMRGAPAIAGANTTAHFYLDRRLVASAVATATADRRARR
jgi:tape measure domain-containing protein